jgi:hypothetical protein
MLGGAGSAGSAGAAGATGATGSPGNESMIAPKYLFGFHSILNANFIG